MDLISTSVGKRKLQDSRALSQCQRRSASEARPQNELEHRTGLFLLPLELIHGAAQYSVELEVAVLELQQRTAKEKLEWSKITLDYTLGESQIQVDAE